MLSTGTELRAPGETLEAGQIYESNAPMLAAAFEAAGAEVERIGPVADDEGEHRRALEHGLEADVLVSSGGVSVGPHDLVRRILAELGVEEDFWGVAVRPGKPLAFGVRGRTLVFGLPGNPVSALVGVELFVRPALLALQGATDPEPAYETASLAAPLRRNAARDELARARTRRDAEGTVLEPLTGQESHMIARAAGADALVLVPVGEGRLEPASASAISRCGRSERLSLPPHLRSSRGTRPPSNRSRGPLRGIRPLRIRRVPADGQSGQLRRDREPGEGERDDDPRDVPDGDEREQVPRRLDPERELRREGEQEDERAGEAEHQQATAGERPGRLRLRQPEPGVERGQQVDERERVRRDDEQCDQPECDQGDRVACEGLLRPSRLAGESGAHGRRASR